MALQVDHFLQSVYCTKSLYNMIHYNMVLDIKQFRDGPQNVAAKQKMAIFYIYTFLFGNNMVV